MHLQVTVFNIQREVQSFALNCVGESGGYIEIQRVAEFISLGRPAGFDSGCGVASIVAAKARLAQRAEQVSQGAKAEEIQTFVCNFEAGLGLQLANLSASSRAARRIMGLVDRDV